MTAIPLNRLALFLSALCLWVGVASLLPLVAAEPVKAGEAPSRLAYRDIPGPFLREGAYDLWRSMGLIRPRLCAKPVVALSGAGAQPPAASILATCPGGGGLLDCTPEDFCNPDERSFTAPLCGTCSAKACSYAPGYSCCYCAVQIGPCAGCDRDKTCN
jgi:hypothetical protein